VTIELGVNSAS